MSAKYSPEARREDRKNAAKIKRAFKKLAKKYGSSYAEVGVVENSVGVDRRTGKAKEISVAEEAALNEYGAPDQNIPPRPFMQLTIANNKDAWSSALESLLKSKMPTDRALEAVAILARDAVKATISSGNGLLPNSPATVKIKGRNQPLVDFGDLLKSISYQMINPDIKEGGK